MVSRRAATRIQDRVVLEPSDVLRLRTTLVKNTSGVAKNFSCLPPHGRYLQPGEEYSFPGSPSTWLATRQVPAATDYLAYITTATTGAWSVTYPAGKFAAAPNVQCTVFAAGTTRGHACVVTAASASGCSGIVRRERTLPVVIALLGTLVGYDTEEDPGAVTVYLTAKPNS